MDDLLIEDKGVNFEFNYKDGRTPLSHVVRLLLDKGANIKLKGKNGRMPL